MQPWLVVGSSIGLTVVAIGLVVYFAVYKVRSLRIAGRARVDAEVLQGRAPQLIDEAALFFGLQSKGAVQLRGNGCLVLTDDALVFVQWVTDRVVRVPLRDLLEVDQAKGHLGKRIARPLLRVRWRVEGGEETTAWFVHDLAPWLHRLGVAGADAHAPVSE